MCCLGIFLLTLHVRNDWEPSSETWRLRIADRLSRIINVLWSSDVPVLGKWVRVAEPLALIALLGYFGCRFLLSVTTRRSRTGGVAFVLSVLLFVILEMSEWRIIGIRYDTIATIGQVLNWGLLSLIIVSLTGILKRSSE